MSSCVLEFAQAAEHKMNNVQSFVISTARLAQSAERKALEAIVAAARRYIMFFALHDALRHGPYRLVVRRRAVAATALARLLVGTFASCARGSDSRGHALSH